MVEPVTLAAAGAVISFLLAGNLFFVKRLVDKIDKVDQIEIDLVIVMTHLGINPRKRPGGLILRDGE